jgi:hypothetical protein
MYPAIHGDTVVLNLTLNVAGVSSVLAHICNKSYYMYYDYQCRPCNLSYWEGTTAVFDCPKGDPGEKNLTGTINTSRSYSNDDFTRAITWVGGEVCDDGIDNNGDHRSDYDDSDGLRGDPICPVNIEAFDVPGNRPTAHSVFQANVTLNVANVNSVMVMICNKSLWYLPNAQCRYCNLSHWLGTTAVFDCPSGEPGKRNMTARINTSKSWSSSYNWGTNLNIGYEICGDGIDNDGNGMSDYDDSDGLLGDPACPLQILGTRLSDYSPVSGPPYYANVTLNVGGVNSLYVGTCTSGHILYPNHECEACTFIEWVGNTATYECPTGPPGKRNHSIMINQSQSYTSGWWNGWQTIIVEDITGCNIHGT